MKRILKITGIVIGIIAALMIGMAVIFGFIISSNDKEKGDYKEVLTNDASVKKALIVFQPSLSGLTGEIADEIAKGLHDSGYEVTLTYPHKNLTADVKDYTVLVFGSPVYVGKPSSLITGFLNEIKDYSGSKVVLYAAGSAKEAPELDIMEDSMNGSKAFKKIKFNTNDRNAKETAYKLGVETGKD